MATPYYKIYEKALSKITDYDLATIPNDDLQATLHGWLMSAISKFRKCKNDLSDRDDELGVFNVDLIDEEIEILALLIVSEWLEPQVNSVNVTLQMFGGKEEKLWQYFAHSSLYPISVSFAVTSAIGSIGNTVYLFSDLSYTQHLLPLSLGSSPIHSALPTICCESCACARYSPIFGISAYTISDFSSESLNIFL